MYTHRVFPLAPMAGALLAFACSATPIGHGEDPRSAQLHETLNIPLSSVPGEEHIVVVARNGDDVTIDRAAFGSRVAGAEYSAALSVPKWDSHLHEPTDRHAPWVARLMRALDDRVDRNDALPVVILLPEPPFPWHELRNEAATVDDVAWMFEWRRLDLEAKLASTISCIQKIVPEISLISPITAAWSARLSSQSSLEALLECPGIRRISRDLGAGELTDPLILGFSTLTGLAVEA